ncbi:DUF2161 domain-containing phosphodiesterase [Pararhizobium arenae]|uniref:DUF2161 domain-containing phosphodiesterase n=1 Tax=Pararhizobium arenae TaxID=1856850 RepID=UPI00094B3DB1|nr:DUF2161 family putative PD-(D/E)XK-type phosphodiesterase [Pararhizobium arenae]
METELYLPIKRFLEEAGYQVKGEIGGCDIVGLSADDPPVVVICELKLTFNLELVLQAVDRAAASDEIWIAARVSAKGKGRERDKRFRDLCRRLGFGMLGVSDLGTVDILVSPTAFLPRKNTKKRSRLVAEHQRRKGDPTRGGATRQPIMTAYRQRTLDMARMLEAGPLRPRDMKTVAPDAAAILLRNVYGWFDRLDRGIYGLNDTGRDAIVRWPVRAPGED